MKRTPHVERVLELLKQESVNSSIRHKVCNIRDNLWLSDNHCNIFGCLGNTYEDIALHRGVQRTVAAYAECCQRTIFNAGRTSANVLRKINIMFKVDFAPGRAYIAFKVLIQLDDDEHG